MAAVQVQPPSSVPSYMRSLPGSVNIPLAKFPASPASPPASSPDASQAAKSLLESFNKAIASADFPAVARLFVEDGYWRDHLALSWQFRTVQSPSKIAEFLEGAATSKDGLRLTKLSVDESTVVRAPRFAPIDAEGSVSGIQLFIQVETRLGSGLGLARLALHHGEWKIFTLYTRLDELRGFGSPLGSRRPKGVEHGGKPGRKNWAERRAAAANFRDGNEPAVLIIGMLPSSKMLKKRY